MAEDDKKVTKPLKGTNKVIDSSMFAPSFSLDFRPKKILDEILKNNLLKNGGESKELNECITAAGIYNRNQLQFYDAFNRFGCIDPYNTVTTTREYLFFTKPDLHIFENLDPNILNAELARIPLFQEAMIRYKAVLKQLQISSKENTGPFMNLLSNTVRSNLDLPGISADDLETASNVYGTAISYRRESNKSDENHEFSLEFEDTKYLEVYMLFKLFDEYERRKYFGDITPPDKLYRYRKVLHDQIAIYKFIVGEDGETLLYWAKLYGCYPKTVPRDAFSDMSSNGGLRYTVQWKAQFVEDMDPQILNDFNILIKPLYTNTYKSELPLYNVTHNRPDGNWAGIPYVASRQVLNSMDGPSTMSFKYKLKWRA